MNKCFFIMVLWALLATGVYATDFYVNPQTGSINYDGSKEKPWRTLKEVFDNNLIQTKNWAELPYKKDADLKVRNLKGVVKGGDTIWLYSGEHGAVNVRGYYNDDFITIKAVEGEKPVLNCFNVKSGSFWKLSGLQFLASTNSAEKGVFASLVSHGFNGPANDLLLKIAIFLLQQIPQSGL